MIVTKTSYILHDLFQITVFIRVVFVKVGEIDTLKETFMADAFIQAKWREPDLDGKRHVVSDAVPEHRAVKSQEYHAV